MYEIDIKYSNLPNICACSEKKVDFLFEFFAVEKIVIGVLLMIAVAVIAIG